jgi:hypothetical protein
MLELTPPRGGYRFAMERKEKMSPATLIERIRDCAHYTGKQWGPPTAEAEIMTAAADRIALLEFALRHVVGLNTCAFNDHAQRLGEASRTAEAALLGSLDPYAT